jgi:hypothetical protein
MCGDPKIARRTRRHLRCVHRRDEVDVRFADGPAKHQVAHDAAYEIDPAIAGYGHGSLNDGLHLWPQLFEEA